MGARALTPTLHTRLTGSSKLRPTQVMTASLSPVRVVQRRRCRTFSCSRAKNDSLAASPPAEATAPATSARRRCPRLRRHTDVMN